LSKLYIILTFLFLSQKTFWWGYATGGGIAGWVDVRLGVACLVCVVPSRWTWSRRGVLQSRGRRRSVSPSPARFISSSSPTQPYTNNRSVSVCLSPSVRHKSMGVLSKRLDRSRHPSVVFRKFECRSPLPWLDSLSRSRRDKLGRCESTKLTILAPVDDSFFSHRSSTFAPARCSEANQIFVFIVNFCVCFTTTYWVRQITAAGGSRANVH